MLGHIQNLDFVASLKADATNLEVVDFNSNNLSEVLEVEADALSCFGTFGTFGTAGGCCGTFGTFGCL
jgi:hypothetical protein